MADGGSPVNELRAYFRGINAALNLLERRLAARPELSGDQAIAEIQRYHRVVRENLANLDEAAATAAPGTDLLGTPLPGSALLAIDAPPR